MSLKDKILQAVRPYISIPVVGIDVSDISLKYAAFTNKKPYELDFFGELKIAEGIIENGDIKKEEELVKICRELFNKEGKKMDGKFAAISLPEEKSFLRLIQIPKVSEKNVDNAVKWEIEANIPLARENLIYDYEIIEPLVPKEISDHIDVSITAFPKNIVESYTKVFKKAGLNIASLELESQAIIRAAMPNISGKEAGMIVDIGNTRTSLIVFAGRALNFTSTFKLGGRDIENNIMKALKVDDKKAAEIKKKHGLDKNLYEGELFAALTPLASSIADELKRAIFYYRDHTKHVHGADAEISKVLLVGGDANLFGLDAYLTQNLKIPTYAADVFINIKNEATSSIKSMPAPKSLAFATALGLALKEIKNPC